MKKMIKILGVLIVLVIVAVVGVFFFLGTIVKSGVEKAGPRVTKTDVKLNSASLSLFSGSGELKGFVVGNPEGFKSPSIIKVGTMSVQVEPKSVMSDKVVIHSVKVVAPEITLEGDLSGNNLSKLLDNIKGSSEKDKQTTKKEEKSSQKKLQVDDFLISGAKVQATTSLLGGASGAVTIPDIHLSNLGQGENGITAAELAEKVVSVLLQNTLQAVTQQAGNVGKVLTEGIKGGGTGAVQNIEKATKGIGDIFKKK
jgi:uncharacterized protein involved in outer membrane biogenesis